MLLAGCISANPAPDLARTAALADPRTSVDSSLDELWSKPWQDRTGSWDGRSALGADDAVRAALRNDPALRRHLAMVAERRADLAQASLPPNPVVDVVAGAAIDGMSGAPLVAQVLQQLTWLWTLGDRIDAADAERDAAIFHAAHRVVTASALVRTTYARTMCMERLVELDAAYVETTARTERELARLHRGQRASSTDVERARIEAAQARADHASARLEYRGMQLELLRLMGMPEVRTDWATTGNLAATLDYDPPDEDEVVRRAATLRLDVAAAERFVDAAEAGERLAGWTRFPQISLVTGFRRNFSERRAWMTGAAVSLPLLDTGYAAVAGAAARHEQAELAVAELRQDAIMEARVARNAWLRARQQARLYRTDLVPPAMRVVGELLDADAADEAHVNALLLSQHRMITLERAMVLEMLEGAIAWVNLETAVGGSLRLPLSPAPG